MSKLLEWDYGETVLCPSQDLEVEYLSNYQFERWGELGYANAGDSGFDLRAAIETEIVIQSGTRVLVPCGIRLNIPLGHEIQIRPRSGLAYKHGLTVANSPGTVDQQYRGEIIALMINHGPTSYRVNPGDRIAQAVLAPVTFARLVKVASVSTSTERGEGRLGSSGQGANFTRKQ